MQSCTHHVPPARDARQSIRSVVPMALHPPLHLRRYLSLAAPRHAPRPRTSPSPCSSTTSPKRSAGSDDDAAPATSMADVDAVAGAACHCARPAPPSPSGGGGGGCGGSDEHHQRDVIMLRRTRSGRAFPPPISVIGKGGRPWLSLRAHREGGRLVLREMRLPSQELLQPCKEDGRFKLLIHPEAGGRVAAVAPQERQGKDKSALEHS